MEFKKSQFNDWYNEVIELSKLADKRYPVKGMDIWMPYGLAIMQNIDSYYRLIFNKYGHQELNFPLLIPKDQFDREEEHIKGFTKQVFWVERAGDDRLDIPLILRPTSETAMYHMFSLWIRTHADLPLKYYQIVNVFRYETKQTRTFMRVREIHFFEAHTAHKDFKDSEKQIEEDLKIWKKICDKLAIPYIINKRPDWDKFPGAFYSLGADTIMPNGRALQIGTIHQYSDNFAKAYDIKYNNENGKQEYVSQTTFGISERILGAIVGIHGDDHGLILPPEIAPIQIIIVPIISEDKENVIKESKKLYNKLKKRYRANIDLREDYTPGFKFYDWELKGVPLRIEIGPRDIKNNEVICARRDTYEKIRVKKEDLTAKIKELLNDIQSNLYVKAKKQVESLVLETDDLQLLKEEEKMFKVSWCGKEECGNKIAELSDKSVLGVPIEEKNKKGKCIICGAETDIKAYVGKTY